MAAPRSGNNEPPHRSHGPWIIKAVGAWGTGKRSAFDFEIYILDLGRPPEDDPEMSVPRDSQVASAFFTEDEEPAAGLDFDLGDQAFRLVDERTWAIEDVE